MIFVISLLPVGSVLAHLFKVTRINYSIGAAYHYFYLVFAVFLVWGLIAIFGRFTRIRLLYLLFVISIFSYAISVTITSPGEVPEIVGNLLRLAIFLGLLGLAVFNREILIEFCMDYTDKLSFISFIVVASSIAFMYLCFFIRGNVYFGLQTTVLFLTLSYAMIKRENLLVLSVIVLMMLSGKRGVMLGAALMIFYHYFWLILRGKSFTVIANLIVMFLFISGAIYFGLLPEAINRKIETVLTSGWNLSNMNVARAEEADYVLSAIMNSNIRFFFGGGLGSSVDVREGVGTTVHISPLAVAFLYGVPFSIVFYSLLCLLLIAPLFSIVKTSGRLGTLLQIWAYVVVAEVGFSLTAFTVFQSVTLWLGLAIVISIWVERVSEIKRLGSQ